MQSCNWELKENQLKNRHAHDAVVKMQELIMLSNLPNARPSMQIRHTLVSWSFCSLFKPIVNVRSEGVETNANKCQALEDKKQASVARVVLVCAPKLSIQKPAGYSPPINLKNRVPENLPRDLL